MMQSKLNSDGRNHQGLLASLQVQAVHAVSQSTAAVVGDSRVGMNLNHCDDYCTAAIIYHSDCIDTYS